MLIRRNLRVRRSLRHAQRGMSLMELLVAGAISIITSSGMMILMINTVGTGSLTVQMTRVTHDMRVTMSIMTRELRRANYHSGYMSCYGNANCLTNMPGLGDITARVGSINIEDNDNSDCFWFWYDRPQSGAEVAVTAETVAAFRRTVVGGTVGKIQMTTLRSNAPDCDADTDWVDITNPDIVDILTFNVSDAQSLTETINVSGNTQNVERIALSMTAKLIADNSLPAWIRNNASTTRELQEFVLVRNHTTTSVL